MADAGTGAADVDGVGVLMTAASICHIVTRSHPSSLSRQGGA